MPANSPPLKSDIERHHYYPLFLDITGRECVVIGGGSVAERKAMMLLKFNASVTVISPKVTKKLSLLGDSGLIRIIPRKYRRGDIDSAAIVFACTDERPVNTKIREDAGVKGTPVNVVDKPLECDFIVPSIIKKGDITIAISTSGLLPMASKKIRQAIEKTVTADYVAYTRVIGAFRKHLLRTVPDGSKRRAIMKAVGKMEIRDILNAGLAGMKEIFGEHIK